MAEENGGDEPEVAAEKQADAECLRQMNAKNWPRSDRPPTNPSLGGSFAISLRGSLHLDRDCGTSTHTQFSKKLSSDYCNIYSKSSGSGWT